MLLVLLILLLFFSVIVVVSDIRFSSVGIFLDFDDPARVCALLLEHHALFLLLCLVGILARLLLL